MEGSRSRVDKMDYVSNRVFDGKRALSADRADALRSLYTASKPGRPATAHKSSIFGILLAIPAMAFMYFVKR